MPSRADPKDWYDLPRWRRRRSLQLKLEPLCRLCAERGQITPATVADHITPWSNWNDFVLGELQSLCKPCHDGPKQQIDKHGYSRDIGPDGYPTDRHHPCYGRR
jgi:hypothetical protein